MKFSTYHGLEPSMKSLVRRMKMMALVEKEKLNIKIDCIYELITYYLVCI